MKKIILFLVAIVLLTSCGLTNSSNPQSSSEPHSSEPVAQTQPAAISYAEVYLAVLAPLYMTLGSDWGGDIAPQRFMLLSLENLYEYDTGEWFDKTIADGNLTASVEAYMGIYKKHFVKGADEYAAMLRSTDGYDAVTDRVLTSVNFDGYGNRTSILATDIRQNSGDIEIEYVCYVPDSDLADTLNTLKLLTITSQDGNWKFLSNKTIGKATKRADSIAAVSVLNQILMRLPAYKTDYKPLPKGATDIALMQFVWSAIVTTKYDSFSPYYNIFYEEPEGVTAHFPEKAVQQMIYEVFDIENWKPNADFLDTYVDGEYLYPLETSYNVSYGISQTTAISDKTGVTLHFSLVGQSDIGPELELSNQSWHTARFEKITEDGKIFLRLAEIK